MKQQLYLKLYPKKLHFWKTENSFITPQKKISASTKMIVTQLIITWVNAPANSTEFKRNMQF